MVLPLKDKSYFFDSKSRSFHKVWQSQKPPFTLRLPCRLWSAWANDAYGNSASWAVDEESTTIGTALRNKARLRLTSELGDTSQVGAAIAAEWRGSAKMISDRALQLLRFTNAVRKRRFHDAATILGITTPKGWRKFHARDFGSVWLEYSYGWAPLVGDIYTSMKIIERQPKDHTIKGRAHGNVYLRKQNSPTQPYLLQEYWFDHKVQMIGEVRVNNPNLFLSNQLGLVNPASWVLEGIAFSFVVDWFSNLSQWVSQLTDFVGLDLINSATTNLVNARDNLTLFGYGGEYPRGDKSFYCLKRSLGIPSAKLHFDYEVVNWRRGLNIISLLTQALK